MTLMMAFNLHNNTKNEKNRIKIKRKTATITIITNNNTTNTTATDADFTAPVGFVLVVPRICEPGQTQS